MNSLLISLLVASMGAVAYFTKRIMDETGALRTEMGPIVPAIIEIQGKFTQAGHKLLFPVTVTPGSPLILTEYGQKLAEDSGFNEIIRQYGSRLVRAVKARKPTTNYDIQIESTNVLKDLLESDDRMLKSLKTYAFNNGLSLEILLPPAGIVLRDEVMKELKFSDEI